MSSSLRHVLENISRAVSVKDEGCKKELALAILLHKPSVARKMRLQYALSKLQVGFANWKVSIQAKCMMPIISLGSLQFDDAACGGMMAFCGEAAAFVSKVQAMEDDEHPGDGCFCNFRNTKTMLPMSPTEQASCLLPNGLETSRSVLQV